MKISSFRTITTVVVIGLISAISVPASGAVFPAVDQASFQAALNVAGSNGQHDTINVSAVTIHLGSTLSYYAAPSENFGLSIVGMGVASTVLDGDSSNLILALDSTGANADNNVYFTVQDITFQNGYYDSYGGGLAMDGHDPDMTIERCNFLLNYADWGGGGVNAYSSTGAVTLRNCIFTGNDADEGYGGGALLESPSGTIVVENSVFSGNYLYYGDGAGAYFWGDTVTVTGNTFINNTLDYDYYGGAGAYIQGDISATITNNTFSGNTAGDISEGGGAYIYSYDSVTMTGNAFTDNSSYYGGGAEIYAENITMNDNTFTGNTASEAGGAYVYITKDAILVNNVFADNTAGSSYGGGMELWMSNADSAATLTNNTIVQNSAPEGGGISAHIYENTGSLDLYNNIIYGNAAATGGDLSLRNDYNSDGFGSTVNIYNNNYTALFYQDGDNITRVDNIGDNPLLTLDYHLNSGSPCIEAGNNAAPNLPAVDMDLQARIINTNVDIGADEYNGPVVTPPVPDIMANGLDTPVTISQGETLSVTIMLDPGGPTVKSAELVDWWVVAQSPTGIFSYAVSGAWQPGIHATHQGALFEIASPYEVLNMSNLPAGAYTFYFGVDMDMDGILDMGELYADNVQVTISP